MNNLINKIYNYINEENLNVDIKIVSIEHYCKHECLSKLHYYDNYYLADFYFIENGKERIDDIHDGAIYVQDGFAYLYRSIEEAKYFELATAMIKIKI